MSKAMLDYLAEPERPKLRLKPEVHALTDVYECMNGHDLKRKVHQPASRLEKLECKCGLVCFYKHTTCRDCAQDMVNTSKGCYQCGCGSRSWPEMALLP